MALALARSVGARGSRLDRRRQRRMAALLGTVPIGLPLREFGPVDVAGLESLDNAFVNFFKKVGKGFVKASKFVACNKFFQTAGKIATTASLSAFAGQDPKTAFAISTAAAKAGCAGFSAAQCKIDKKCKQDALAAGVNLDLLAKQPTPQTLLGSPLVLALVAGLGVLVVVSLVSKS